ncbi:SemiSWEET family sugar transporter [Salinarimonas soli]|uniref:MtN3 and saliva related transmembrane protein n=1 Tax=Salinarimonas soli TaxID=1638099 RepID=A0A5B2VDE7_9HYPH|nr:SemiSWEET transporter [Salinarimonas soli]KAA2236716.1 hypothetical protein F0L46_13185 [Salinarimonas soli]
MPPAHIEAVGFAAAVLTTLCWIPQALRTIRTRDTRAISLVTQAAFTFGVGLWLLYGLLIGSTPVIVANAISIVPVAAILAMKLRFG